MGRLPVQFFCVVELFRVFFIKVALEIKCGAVQKIAFFLWYDNSFIFKLFKDGFRSMVSSARILELYFAITCLLMPLTFPHIFPVLSATGTLKQFTIPGEIFYVRKMLFVQVQVKSVFIVAM